jgi:hypothetical protein
MGTTLDLQNELKELLGSDNVYFQPPSNLRMQYPCIVFNRGSANHNYANNKVYKFVPRYSVTYISYDPDPDLIKRMVEHFQMIKYDNHYVSDNLQHDVFSLYW